MARVRFRDMDRVNIWVGVKIKFIDRVSARVKVITLVLLLWLGLLLLELVLYIRLLVLG